MKIKITYKTIETKEIDLTPEEYCHYHAYGFKSFLPEKLFGNYDVELTEEAQKELDNFFFNKI